MVANCIGCSKPVLARATEGVVQQEDLTTTTILILIYIMEVVFFKDFFSVFFCFKKNTFILLYTVLEGKHRKYKYIYIYAHKYLISLQNLDEIRKSRNTLT